MRQANRRDVLKSAGAALLLAREENGAETGLRVAGEDVEIQIAPVSAHTFRVSVAPLRNGQPVPVPNDGTLVQSSWGATAAKWRGTAHAQTVRSGNLRVHFVPDPLGFAIETSKGERVQKIGIDRTTGAVTFATG
ncbi:MAG TPA: hypothetical protein VGH38_12110, partial [Bryobacteraceae bacterium]